MQNLVFLNKVFNYVDCDVPDTGEWIPLKSWILLDRKLYKNSATKVRETEECILHQQDLKNTLFKWFYTTLLNQIV